LVVHPSPHFLSAFISAIWREAPVSHTTRLPPTAMAPQLSRKVLIMSQCGAQFANASVSASRLVLRSIA
jgi:hypothetical protein